MRGKVNIINVSIPPVLLHEIDEWAFKTSRGRSDFLREAARRFIDKLKGEKLVF